MTTRRAASDFQSGGRKLTENDVAGFGFAIALAAVLILVAWLR